MRRALGDWFHRRGWAQGIIAIPYLWLVIFFLLPFIIVVAMSFATRTPTAPPFGFGGENPVLNTEAYLRLVQDDLYIRAFLTSVSNAGMATLLCLLLGFPMALGLTRVDRSWRNILVMLVILPFWTSYLLRIYAWMGLFGSNSWFNTWLTAGWNAVVPAPLALDHIPMMNTNFAVVVVMIYSYLPFMILPLYATLERLDRNLDEAAMDLGARPARVFFDITLPQSLPGVAAGALLVFIPASGELMIPALVGSSAAPMIGRVISDEFAQARDWPMASAVAVALLLLLVVPLMVYSWLEGRDTAPRRDGARA